MRITDNWGKKGNYTIKGYNVPDTVEKRIYMNGKNYTMLADAPAPDRRTEAFLKLLEEPAVQKRAAAALLSVVATRQELCAQRAPARADDSAAGRDAQTNLNALGQKITLVAGKLREQGGALANEADAHAKEADALVDAKQAAVQRLGVAGNEAQLAKSYDAYAAQLEEAAAALQGASLDDAKDLSREPSTSRPSRSTPTAPACASSIGQKGLAPGIQDVPNLLEAPPETLETFGCAWLGPGSAAFPTTILPEKAGGAFFQLAYNVAVCISQRAARATAEALADAGEDGDTQTAPFSLGVLPVSMSAGWLAQKIGKLGARRRRDFLHRGVAVARPLLRRQCHARRGGHGPRLQLGGQLQHRFSQPRALRDPRER